MTDKELGEMRNFAEHGIVHRMARKISRLGKEIVTGDTPAEPCGGCSICAAKYR
jgi:hydrogenase maturation factor